jgi:polysaccharide chain length determinant protein (PEP-CTERM system associated)
MIPGKTYTQADFLRIAWRRKWVILLPFVLVSIATFIVVQFLPNLYISKTTILVVPQRVPDSYVKSTVSAPIEDRLRSISEQILSRSRLERIVQEYNLYVKERRRQTMEVVVEKMRKDIGVETVKGDSFTVSYISDDARVAMGVTQRLAAMFIEESLRDRVVLAEGTNQFLESQLEDARQRLVEHEKKLAVYRERFEGELPTQLQSNLQVEHNAETQLQSIIESINRDRDRRLLQERLLADARQPLDIEAATPTAAAATGKPSLPSGMSAAEQLEDARNTLRDLQLRLTPSHPDIVRSERAVRELEAKVAAEALKRPVSKDVPAVPLTAVQVAQRNRLRELQLEVQNLDEQIARKQAEQQRVEGVIATYQRRIAAVPTHESELTELMRDYDTLQKTYVTLLGKKEDSKISANLERRQIGEQFKILDPARVPELPFSPKRAQLDLMGAVFGLSLGLGLTALLEHLDSSLKTEDDVLQALMLPVLALIPLMSSGNDQRRSGRRRAVVLSCVAAGVVLISAAAAWKLDAIGWVR